MDSKLNARRWRRSETRTFAIENMTCAACPITVRKAIQRVDGVKSVDVDFRAKAATPDAIAQASTDAGYPARQAAHGG